MGKNPQISATLPAHVHEAIGQRAAILGDSMSNYLGAIASWWFGQGCPAIRPDEAHMMALSKRLKSVPENLDAWNLNPNDVYQITGDKVVQRLLRQLGIPNVFAQTQEHDHVHAFDQFDNHPTHWIVVHLFKGHQPQYDNGLLFQAEPKSSTTREQLLEILKRSFPDDTPREIVFSHLPTRSASATHRQTPTIHRQSF
jgi:hypothetical protein